MLKFINPAFAGKKAELAKYVDILGLVTTLWMVLRAWIYPGDTAWFAALGTVVCFWIAVRTVVIYSCGDSLFPSPAALFLLIAMITNHLGAYVWYNSGWAITVEQSAAWNMIWGFNLAYLAFAFGIYLYAKLSGINSRKLVNEFYSRPVQVPASEKALLLPTAIIFTCGLTIALFLLGGGLPILDVIKMMAKGGYLEAQATAEASRHFLSSQHVYRGQAYLDQARIAIMPMMVIFWIVCAIVSRSQLYRWISWAGAVALVTVLISGLERSPFILFIIQLSVVLMLIAKPKPNIRWIYGAAGTFAAFTVLTVMLGRGFVGATFVENIVLKFRTVLTRIYLSNSLSSVTAFELFPEHLSFRYGATWARDIANLLPGPGEGISAEIYKYLWNETGSGGVHFIAEMWANGGFGMILFVSLVFGVFVQWFSYLALKMKNKTPLSLTYYGLLMFCIGLLGYGGFMTPVNRGLIAFVVINAILLGFARIACKLRDTSGRRQAAKALAGESAATSEPG